MSDIFLKTITAMLPTRFTLDAMDPERAFNLGAEFADLRRWIWDRSAIEKRVSTDLWPLIQQEADRRGVGVSCRPILGTTKYLTIMLHTPE